MAKQTALQLVNKVLSNLGESEVSALTSLTGLSLLVFNTYNEVLYDLAFEESGHWKPLEADATVVLTSAVTTYAKPTVLDYDRNSFRYDGTSSLTFYTPQRFDLEKLNSTESGTPKRIIDWGSYFKPHPVPDSGANAKNVTWREWAYPTVLDTGTATGTCWIPEGFDLTLLADLVTYKIMHYKHNEEAAVYYAKVYGDGRMVRGSLDKFKSLWRTHEILDGDNMMVAVI